ncbi:hypothetical protein JCM30566_18410 [Marinitoga arctica]
MKKFYLFSLILIILLISLFLFYKNNVLKIGIIANFSGDETFTMVDIKNAVNLFYLKNKNPNIKVYYKDTQGIVENSLKAYNYLKNKGIKIIIFATDSTSFKKIYPLLKNDKILGIGTSITSDSYTASNDYFIRVNITNKNEQKQLAEYLNTKTSRILVVKGFENPEYINNSFENFNKFYFGNINLIPLYNSIQSIEKIKLYYNNENYAYIMVNSLNKTALIINLLKKLNPNIYAIVFPWINDEHLIELLDDKKNIILPSYFSKNSDFAQHFFSVYYKNPNIYAYTVYESLRILYDSYKKTGNNLEKIRNYILNNEFNTEFGIIKFDENGETKKKLLFKVMK